MVLGSSSTLNLGGFSVTNGTDAPVMIAQNAGSTGTIVIGGGVGTSGADIGARVFNGGAGEANVRFTQQFAAGSTNDTIYPFYTTLTGSVGITQAGAGTTKLQPLYGTNTFTGEVTVDSGTLATAGSVAALAGASGVTINTNGVFAIGQSDGVNDAAFINMNGGVLQTGISLTETLGPLTINGPSRIDFMGNTSTLVFSALGIIDTLAFWNYSPDDTITILSGLATGDLDKITFYSDSGTTSLGTAMFVGNDIMPVPEPSTYALLALSAAGLGGYVLRRRRK
jgi:autotransporter-associated beta strand protein